MIGGYYACMEDMWDDNDYWEQKRIDQELEARWQMEWEEEYDRQIEDEAYAEIMKDYFDELEAEELWNSIGSEFNDDWLNADD